MRATRSIIAVVVAFIAALGVTSVGAADLTKTLHVSFPIAETGFDPQPVGDVYSSYVNRVIFDPLYRYDYLARRQDLDHACQAGHFLLRRSRIQRKEA